MQQIIANRITQIIENISDEQITDYIKTGPDWLSIDDVRSSQHLLRQASIRAYAGHNPMQHHDTEIVFGGMSGATQTLAKIISPEAAKVRAGAWIVAARRCRARGDLRAARQALTHAASNRKYAAETIAQQCAAKVAA